MLSFLCRFLCPKTLTAFERRVAWEGEVRFSFAMAREERSESRAFDWLSSMAGVTSASKETDSSGCSWVHIELYDGFEVQTIAASKEENRDAVITAAQLALRHLVFSGPPKTWEPPCR